MGFLISEQSKRGMLLNKFIANLIFGGVHISGEITSKRKLDEA
tara:strand:+ start:78 stop:206 length:129 start_codon:yes stop_codon:yes gene_type:complete